MVGIDPIKKKILLVYDDDLHHMIQEPSDVYTLEALLAKEVSIWVPVNWVFKINIELNSGEEEIPDGSIVTFNEEASKLGYHEVSVCVVHRNT